ncbi:hypothetical protein EDB83DRAFT_2316777 [Lactarius deliciosus]|nr:hypothetical protein EDB83DRAFT_2316777 [Lactarius deliciosus]
MPSDNHMACPIDLLVPLRGKAPQPSNEAGSTEEVFGDVGQFSSYNLPLPSAIPHSSLRGSVAIVGIARNRENSKVPSPSLSIMHLHGDARCRAASMHLGLWLFVPTLFIQRMDGAWCIDTSARFIAKLVLAEEKQGDDLSRIVLLLRITNDDLPGDCIIAHFDDTPWGQLGLGGRREESGVLRVTTRDGYRCGGCGTVDADGATGTVLRSAGGVGVFSRPPSSTQIRFD